MNVNLLVFMTSKTVSTIDGKIWYGLLLAPKPAEVANVHLQIGGRRQSCAIDNIF